MNKDYRLSSPFVDVVQFLPGLHRKVPAYKGVHFI